MCREVRDAIHKRVRRAQIVDALVYSQILIAAQNPSGQIFAASEKPRRDLVPESNMLFIGAAASRGTSGLMVNVPTLTRVGVTGPRGCVRPVLMHMHAWAAPQTRTVGPRLLRVYSGSLAF